MKLSQVMVLVGSLRKSLEDEDRRLINPSENSKVEFQNILNLCYPFLDEHSVFLNNARSLYRFSEIRRALDYIELLLKLKSEEKIIEEEGIFLNSAKDQLRQAGVAFQNQDFPGVSNKLNTCVELALKDVLEIPTTIKGIKTSNIIDIMISEKMGPTKYLEEVKKYVLLDNLVKHQGLNPIEVRAGMAITAVENLLKKLPKEPFFISEEIKEKIWKGIR